MATFVEYTIKLNDQFSKGLKTASAGMSKFKGSVSKLNASISSMGTLIGGAAVLGGIKSSINAWNEQEQAVAQVRQGIVSTGNAADRSLAQLTKQASDLQNQTLFGDEEIMKGVTSQLLTFTNIAGDEFDRTQKAVLDVTTKLYGADASAESLRSTSIQLAKALNDPVANLGALGRSGIQFSAEQKELIKTLAKTGRTAEAQGIILKEIEGQYGGAAKAAADAGTGGLKQLQNRFGDIQETIGGVLMPVIARLTTFLGKLASWIENNKQKFTAILKAVGGAVVALGALIATIKILNFVMSINPIGLIIAGFVAATAAVIYFWNTSEKFRGTLLGLWEAIKQIGLVLKIYFIDGFKEALSSLGVFVKAFKLLIKGEFKKAGATALDGIKKLGGTESKKNALKAGMQIGSKFREGFASGKDAVKIGPALTGSSAGPGGVTPTSTANALTPTETKLTGAAPKIFNINIDKMTGVEQFINSKGSVKETKEDIAKIFQEVMMGMLADIQISKA